MTQKKQRELAKKMYKSSLTHGLVNSLKVQQVIKEAFKNRVQNLPSVLKAYKRLIETALKKEVLIIESATPITNQKSLEAQIRAKTKANKVNFEINPNIIVGARITHGDWIYDATLDTELNQLKEIK